jgi:Mg2+ and Co2+ transporter CorA
VITQKMEARSDGPCCFYLSCRSFRTVDELHLSRDNLKRLLASGSFFWIDLPRPPAKDFAVLRDVFQFHPLAIEDSEHFGQRAKLDDYDDFVFLVVTALHPTRTGLSRCTASIPNAF